MCQGWNFPTYLTDKAREEELSDQQWVLKMALLTKE